MRTSKERLIPAIARHAPPSKCNQLSRSKQRLLDRKEHSTQSEESPAHSTVGRLPDTHGSFRISQLGRGRCKWGLERPTARVKLFPRNELSLAENASRVEYVTVRMTMAYSPLAAVQYLADAADWHIHHGICSRAPKRLPVHVVLCAKLICREGTATARRGTGSSTFFLVFVV